MSDKAHLLPVLSIDTIYTAFVDSYGEDFCFSGESHPMWELDWVLEGRCIITSGTELYTLTAGESVIHKANIFHTARADGEKVSLMTVSFTGTGLDCRIKGGKYVPSEREISILKLLSEETENSVFSKSEIDKACFRALLEALLLFIARHEPIISERAAEFTEIAEYMQANICRCLTMPELENKFHRSGTSVRNIFRKYTGVSPFEYFNSLRASYAIGLLEKGLTAAETAEQMDFSSPSYFSAFFKKQTGLSPADIKKRLLNF